MSVKISLWKTKQLQERNRLFPENVWMNLRKMQSAESFLENFVILLQTVPSLKKSSFLRSVRHIGGPAFASFLCNTTAEFRGQEARTIGLVGVTESGAQSVSNLICSVRNLTIQSRADRSPQRLHCNQSVRAHGLRNSYQNNDKLGGMSQTLKSSSDVISNVFGMGWAPEVFVSHHNQGAKGQWVVWWLTHVNHTFFKPRKNWVRLFHTF